MLKLFFDIFITSIVFFIGYLFIQFLYFKSTLFMPKEYRIIKNLVNRIASKNNLGEKEIVFSVGSGSYLMYRAQELGLCKEEDSYYFRNLNPYLRNKYINGININEISKQAYIFGGIEAYALRSVVWMSKSSFRSYKNQLNFLAWVIGHEISHIIFNDHISQNKKLLKESKKKKNANQKEFRKLLEMKFSRDTEKNADKNSAKMLINAGFSKSQILKEFTYIATNHCWQVETDLEGTHPGYLERYRALKRFIHKYKVDKLTLKNKSNWEWQYNRRNNSLTFFPKN